MVRLALVLAMSFAVAASACGLEELVADYPAGTVGGSGGTGGTGGASCPIETVQTAARASFTTQSVELEEVLSLTLPGAPAPNGWIVLLSARLASQSDQHDVHEVVYRVDGIERGIGQSRSQNGPPEGGGPWQSFDWIPPGGDRNVSVLFRSTRAQYLASIEDLRVVAFAVPDGADLVFVDDPGIQTIAQADADSRVYQSVASVDIRPSAPGKYLVMLALAGSEAPGIASIGVRAVAPGADIWPVESAVLPRPYLANPLDEWQSFLLLRSLESDGTALSVDLQVDGSGLEGSTVRHVRALAMRHDAFPAVHVAADPVERQITASRDNSVGTLELGAIDPCHRLVVAQLVTLQALGPRRARFEGTDLAFDHDLNSDQLKVSYGGFAVLDQAPLSLGTFVSAADPAVPVYARESVIVALEVGGMY